VRWSEALPLKVVNTNQVVSFLNSHIITHFRIPECLVFENAYFFLPRKHDTYLGKRVMYLGGFSTHGFCDGFLFLVKELGFWTNPGHWVRVLDVRWLLYVYCIVNNVTQ
jgi:hypothetical protein